ncbi:MAG: 23S rRNA (uracil(1939)-C(5))-methyltransferase RlmD [candidate division Zixibacteria bacterium]
MGRIIEIDIEDLAYNGKSIGYDNGKVTFVKGGLPGERVEALIIKSRRNYNQAKLLKIITKAPERIEAVCKHYDICGGCIWQDLEYTRQLYYKRRQVIACLEHVGGLKDINVEEITPSPDVFFYRNKMEYSFHVLATRDGREQFVLGLHERGRFDHIFDIEECHLQSQLSNRIVRKLREIIGELSIPVYDLITHRGFMRFVIIREGKNTGQVMVNIVTGEGDFKNKDEFTSRLIAAFPEITTIAWTVNPEKSNIARGEVREILRGPGYIYEEILGYKFRINPGAFFQTNSRQTEALYRCAIELADIKTGDTVLDLYCGAGTIGICASENADEIVGIEIEEESVTAAVENAKINNLGNCSFYCGPVRKVMLDNNLKNKSFSAIFLDPPRAGMHPKALKRLLEIGAQRIIYISCNPATFSRDAAEIVNSGYNLEKIVPFDMFPHTMHIELISLFTTS